MPEYGRSRRFGTGRTDNNLPNNEYNMHIWAWICANIRELTRHLPFCALDNEQYDHWLQRRYHCRIDGFYGVVNNKMWIYAFKNERFAAFIDNDHLAGKMDLTCKIIGLCNTISNRSFLIKILHIIYEQFQQEISFSMPLAECTFENQQLCTVPRCAPRCCYSFRMM